MIQIPLSLLAGAFIGCLFGWTAARLLRSPRETPVVTVDALTREQRLQLFGQCELCCEPASGTARDLDEGTAIRLCGEHLSEVIRYHQQICD